MTSCSIHPRDVISEGVTIYGGKWHMKVLIIINDAPYGSEKAYNALRMAMAIQKEPGDVEVLIFLMADSVTCALPSQLTPNGYYNIERMLKSVISKGGQVKACGGCSEARGIEQLPLLEGVEISNMGQLARWTVEADKVLTF
jgi:uncharacterized protein involved in oxidation of intracellular sulfur